MINPLDRSVESLNTVFVVLGASLLFLSGCAMSADPERMVVTSASGGSELPARLQHAMCIRNVTGGEQTNPMWASEVGDDEFRKALTSSLGESHLLSSEGTCKYSVDVDLLGLAQPVAGISMEVTSHANYKVYDSAGSPVLLATISAPYTAEFSESAYGPDRLKRANEGAIRASITQFLDKLKSIK